MEHVKNRILYSAFSVSAGLAGMVLLSRCSGAGCASCFGCAVPGAGIALMLVFRTRRNGKNGMA